MSQVSQQRLDAQFTWEDTARVQEGLRLFTKILEARLAELEGQRADFDGVIEELTQVALSRINDVLLPTLPVLDEIIRVGFGSERILDAKAFGRSLLQLPTLADFYNFTDAATQTDLEQIAGTVASLLQRLDTIQGGANSALDTFSEIAARFAQEDLGTAAVLDAVAKRIRFDAAQSLTSGQKSQALDNLGLSTLGKRLVAALDPLAVRFLIEAERSLGFTPVQQSGGFNQDVNRIRLGWGTDNQGLRATVDDIEFGRLWMDFNCPLTFSGDTYFQQRLSSGLVIMGGQADSTDPDFRLIFPNAFFNSCFYVQASDIYSPLATEAIIAHSSGINRFGADIRRRLIQSGSVGYYGGPCKWLAVGI